MIDTDSFYDANDQEQVILFACNLCNRTFQSEKGRKIHVSRTHQGSVQTPSQETRNESNYIQHNDLRVLNPLESGFNAPLIGADPNINNDVWYKRWEKVNRLKGKQYDLPSGTASRQFVYSLSEEIESLVRTNIQSERMLVFLTVLLQRDRDVKKSRDIRHLLERRLKLWQDGQFDVLIIEAIRCDSRLFTKKCNNDESFAIKIFSRLMLKGKVRDAVRWLMDNGRRSVLAPDIEVGSSGHTVIDVLKEKHPDGIHPDPSSFVFPDGMDSLPPLQQVEITTNIVERVARKIHGSCGPSGTSAEQWSDFLLRFGNASHRLRSSVAMLGTYLNDQLVPWKKIHALMASRLIALDKNPGVRPIGIGECLRRILSKCMIEVCGSDVADACGEVQLCSGLKGGIEGAVHAMNNLFEDKCQPGSKWGMLLVDAKNAFNSMNRQLALWQARIQWPRCAQYIYNTYRGQSELIIRGTGEHLFSREGSIQGDPLAMPLYGIATLPLIKSLQCHHNIKQCWYADDSAAQGSFEDLLSWWHSLNMNGPMYGYFPEGHKSYLIVSEKDKDEAEIRFNGTGLKIVTGQRYLGGFIGSKNDKECFVKNKVEEWVSIVEKISIAGQQEPQAAYSALTKSVQFQWTYMQRVLDCAEDAYQPLSMALKSKFIPDIFGGPTSDAETALCTLPVGKAGLGIHDPIKLCKVNFETSSEGCKTLSRAIIDGTQLNITEHSKSMVVARNEGRKKKCLLDDQLLNDTMKKFPLQKQRTIERSITDVAKTKISGWLSALPLQKDHFDLSTFEFRDALAVRYNRTPVVMPSSCDGCGEKHFTLNHALCCKTGGLITRRHNEVRDLLGEFCQKAWGNCVKEPIISEEAPGLRGDLAVRGVWEAQREALFDIRVVDTDAPSYVSRSVKSVLSSAEEEKKRKYVQACEQRHATFTPLVTSVDGMFGPQMASFVNVLGERLSQKWNRPPGLILGWIRARVQIAIIRASSMCIRGARTRFRSGESLLGYEEY